MYRMPRLVRALLDDLARNLPALLGSNLVGVYLYGSLTQRAFDAARSDVDCIVVTRRALSEPQFKRIRNWLAMSAKENPWTARLQLSFLIKSRLLAPGSPSCLYQFGRLKRSRSDGNPIIWMNVLDSGVVLSGPRPGSFVPAITSEILYRALRREIGYLREELIGKRRSQWRNVPFYRAYATLTVCRILYSARKATVVSKPRAAAWAIKHLPSRWQSLIASALESDAGRRKRPVSLTALRGLVNFASAELGPARAPGRR